MAQSIYYELLEKVFPRISDLEEKVNGGRKPLDYLYKKMLTDTFSPDQKWETGDVDTRYVAADVVAMDSPLPIKKRDAISTYSGKLPKIGMLKYLKETDLNAINIMKAQYQGIANVDERNNMWARIVKKLTEDSVKCSVGLDERNEYNFLYALSRGYVLVEDEENTGVGIRVDFGYKADNTFGVAVAGTIDRNAIENVLAAADAKGDTITTIAISLATYKKMKATTWARELVASKRGQIYTDPSTLPVPVASDFDEAFADEFGGIKFLKIDRSVQIEKDGKPKGVKPFSNTNLIFLTTDIVGKFVWGELAEKTNPVEGVLYNTIDKYKLISKYSETNPLKEFTHGQALALPVIENVDQIYVLDTTVGPTDTQVKEGDAIFTYNGKNYIKADVISGVKTVAGIELSNSISDADLHAVLNLLSVGKRNQILSGLDEQSDSASGSGS